MHHRTLTLGLALCSLAIVACSPSSPSNGGSSSSSSSTPAMTTDRTDREAVASAILDALATEDWTTLSSYIALSGVRFTPQTHVRVDDDLTFTPAEIADFDTDLTVKTWGTQDGSGLPIDMTNMEYFQKYVWDHDFRNADDVRWNHVQDHGSTIDNAMEVYPTAEIVEYHFDGFDPQYGGMDWRSLRLILESDDDGTYSLVGVIHDEWTP